MIIQSVGSVQFGVEQKHLLKIRMSNFYFVHLGLLAHVVLVWCGLRATGLTTGQVQDKCTAGQVQDKYRTSVGQIQDKYRTSIGQLQDTVLQSSLSSGHASGHCPTPPLAEK